MALRGGGSGGKAQWLLAQSAPLTVAGVHAALLKAAKMGGTRVVDAKRSHLAGLVHATRGLKGRWLVRALQAHYGAGVSLKASVLPALEVAVLWHHTNKHAGGVGAAGDSEAFSRAAKATRSAVSHFFAHTPMVEHLVEV